MSILIGFLTVILVINCLLLMLLVLIQLPKKEAGAGVAFGGMATEALFGAGSGSALTQLTKYAATFFLVLSLTLSILNSSQAQRETRGVEEELQKQSQSAVPGLQPAPVEDVAPGESLEIPAPEGTAPAGQEPQAAPAQPEGSGGNDNQQGQN